MKGFRSAAVVAGMALLGLGVAVGLALSSGPTPADVRVESQAGTFTPVENEFTDLQSVELVPKNTPGATLNSPAVGVLTQTTNHPRAALGMLSAGM